MQLSILFFNGSSMLFLDLFNSCIKPTWYDVFQDVVFERLALIFFRIYNDIHGPKGWEDLSVLFWWPLGPEQSHVLRQVGTSSCLVSILHFSNSFNDVQIFFFPKHFPTWALLNQFCFSLSMNTTMSLRLNCSSDTKKAYIYLHNFSVSLFLCSDMHQSRHFNGCQAMGKSSSFIEAFWAFRFL